MRAWLDWQEALERFDLTSGTLQAHCDAGRVRFLRTKAGIRVNAVELAAAATRPDSRAEGANATKSQSERTPREQLEPGLDALPVGQLQQRLSRFALELERAAFRVRTWEHHDRVEDALRRLDSIERAVRAKCDGRADFRAMSKLSSGLVWTRRSVSSRLRAWRAIAEKR